MITGYKELTGRYLKANKKRTILTIVGIVLSVALISTIGLFFKSMQEAEIQDFKNTYGSWQLYFKHPSEELISKITNNPKVAKSGLFSKGEKIKLDEKVEVEEIVATNKALELLPVKIKKGRFPQNTTEVASEEWVLRKIKKDYKLGEKIKIKDKEYTLTGVLEDSIDNQAAGNGMILTINNDIKKSDSLLLVEISSKTSLKTALRELKQLGNKDTMEENKMLLGTQGVLEGDSSWSNLYMNLAVIIGIVVLSTIAVIYNSFHISVVERIKQFGLLRAIGTTPKQIRKLVFREATVLAIIGLPIGLLCSIIAIYGISFVFKLIGADSVFAMKIYISYRILLLSAVIGLVSIYASAFIPAFFAGRISPLVAISSRNSITKEKFKKRKHFFIGKILGFEGRLAAKNIKRNRKRYRITVFSILISVMLFVAFKSFMDMTLNIYNSNNNSRDIHFSVIGDFNSESDKKLFDNIRALKIVENVYKMYAPNFNYVEIDSDMEVKKVKEIKDVYSRVTSNGGDKTRLKGSITIYDKSSLEASKKYLKSGKLDIEKLNKENGVIVIVKNKIPNLQTKKTYVGPIADIKVGDELNISDNRNKEISKLSGEDMKKIKVMAILEEDPFKYEGGNDGVKIITTEEVGKRLIGKDKVQLSRLDIVIKDVKQEEAAKNELEAILNDKSNFTVINNIDQNRTEKSTILMVQILIYGFVIVVSLIGSVNIINTLTTNIILRKREFGALKAIGLTQKGLRKIIVLEGLLYGIVGAIYGSILGCGLSYIMYKGLGGMRDFAWNIPWNAIIIGTVSAIIIGYLSVLAPLSRIKKDNLIEAIREEG